MADEAESTGNLPIIFVIGLSGTGKTDLGDYASEDLGLLHIEQDTDQHDVIDFWGIRREWDDYLAGKDALPLANAMDRIARRENRKGLILTFSSRIHLSAAHLGSAERAGIVTILLHGTDEDCLNSYLEREKKTGRGFDAARWRGNNLDTSVLFALPEYECYRLQAFTNHQHKDRGELIELLSDRIAELRK